MADKIPTEKMDAVDRQQQEQIDRAMNLAWGAIWIAIVIPLLNFGMFLCAMQEMGEAIKACKALAGR
jgi:hypothetical protein